MNHSILPFSTPTTIISEAIKQAKEWAWDYEKNDFAKKDGRMYLVYQDEAIKLWIWKLFKTDRYKKAIYSWDYGNELKSLIGEGYSPGYVKAEAKRYLQEAIENNLSLYVLQILKLDILFKSSKLIVKLKLKTRYSEVVAVDYEL